MDCLQHGVPVLVGDFPGLRALVAEYPCGAVAGPVEEIVPAIRKILASYDSFADAAVRAYEQRYDARRHFPALLGAIRDLG